MPLDLDGFVTPEQDFKGLNNVASQLYRQKYLQGQMAQRQLATKNAAAKYLSTYLNKKDNFTGTKFDPQINSLIDQAMTTGNDLASKGSDIGTINQVIAPLINRLNTYQAAAKQYTVRKKAILDYYGQPEQKGADVNKISDLLDQYSFPTDPKTGQIDYDNIDPSLNTAMQKIKENNLSDIYDNRGIGEWASKFNPDVRSTVVQTADRSGKQYNSINVNAKPWEDFEYAGKDELGKPKYNPVPKYDHAVDNGNMPIEHDFTQPDGTVVKAPIRLLDEGVFNNLMQSGDSRAGMINGLLRKTLSQYKDENGNPIAMDSPKANLVARAIAYDQLKPYASGHVVTQDKQTISAPQLRVDWGFSPYVIPKTKNESDTKKDDYIHAYDTLDGEIKGWEAKGMTGGMPAQSLENQESKEAVINVIKTQDATAQPNLNNYRVIRGDDGALKIFDKKNNWMGNVSKAAADVNANQKLGVKKKNAAQAGAAATNTQGKTLSLAERMRLNKK